MVCEVKEYYNIVEDLSEEKDVGSYLFENKIKYDLRVTQDIEAEIDFNWMATINPKAVAVYTVKLTSEELLVIMLTFPSLKVTRPKIKEPIKDMARRVIAL